MEGPDAMSSTHPAGYRTAPDHDNTGWPPGVPYIIGNEACERFSYYGMKAILFVHLVGLYLATQGLTEDTASKAELKAADDQATQTSHLFNAAVYALPMIGALLADRLVGKYRVIFWVSIIYCMGHGVLAIGESTLMGMYIGLALIAIGSGGIKPCVSANVGDQFGKANWFRVRTIFQIFYFSINFGSFFATLLMPLLMEWYGPAVAFGVPGVLMLLATIIFWMGRKEFVHIPPKPAGQLGLLDALSSIFLFLSVGHFFFSKELSLEDWWWVHVSLTVGFLTLGLYLFNYRQRLQPDNGFFAVSLYALTRWLRRGQSEPQPAAPNVPTIDREGPLQHNSFWAPAVERFGHKTTEGPVAVLKIISVFFLISIFWALFDQHGTTWTAQAREMDLTLLNENWSIFGWEPISSSTTIKANQVGFINPMLVMMFIPLINAFYNFLERRGIVLSPLRRITIGMFISALSFVAIAVIQHWIDNTGKGQIHWTWQFIPYILLTIGEVLVSVTALEFAYSQAPARMKSTVMGFWALTIALGNVLVVFLAGFEKLGAADKFWIFAGLMAIASVLFGIRARFYVPKDYRQE